MTTTTQSQIGGFVLEKGDQLLRPRQIFAPHGILPFSRSTFYDKVKKGELPQPIHLGERIACWKKSDILAFITSMEVQNNA